MIADHGWVRISDGPNTSTKVGTDRPDIRAFAPTRGVAIAASNSTPQRSDPPRPKLSTIRRSCATPTRMPAAVADNPTAIHDATRGDHGRRRSVSMATAKVATASSNPAPICHFHRGKLLTATPAGYFKARAPASISPQYPPTVPSSARFQGWS